MNSWQEFFKGKRVTQMGLGLLGRGLGDAKFFSQYAEEVIVTDLKTPEQLQTSVDALEGLPGITLVLGEHREADFIDRDFILKGSGVPLVNKYIDTAKGAGIPVYMDAALCCKLLPDDVTVIGVTGTRGKTTTTMIVHEILQATDRTVHLGGNIRGVATLPLLKEIQSGDILLLELDSWQLQGFAEIGLSPNISVFTNFYDDHLDYYKGDRRRYLEDKLAIVMNQQSDDLAVLGVDLPAEIVDEINEKVSSSVVQVTSGQLDDFEMPITLVGGHNKKNLAAAVLAVRALGVSDEDIREAVQNFSGIPGRLQYLGSADGVRWFNDNNATTKEATIAALSAFTDIQGKTILIAGGADKGLEMDDLVQACGRDADHVILLPGTGTDKYLDQFTAACDAIVVATMQEAVDRSRALATDGDVVVMSPGFASFGLFQNEYERNDQFVEAVHKFLEK